VHRRDRLEREIVALLPDSPWQLQVARLRCLRGIDTLSAVGEMTGSPLLFAWQRHCRPCLAQASSAR
jgi:hypothetical protein